MAQTAHAAGPNLISNSALESENGASPVSWSPVFWGNVTPTMMYPAPGRSGNGAKITLSANSNGDARWQHASVAVEPGATYLYSSWYHSSVATEVDIEFRHSDGSVSYGWVANLSSSGGQWKEVTATITVPAGVEQIAVFHLIYSAGTLTIDDTTLAKADGEPDPVPDPDPTPGAFSEGMVTISFDDAWHSQHAHALPILQAAGIKATFYITTEPVWSGWSGYMSPNQVRDLHEKGHEIASHSITHRDLTTLGAEELDREITWPESYLEGVTGGTVLSIAYPYGAVNNSVINALTNLIPSERHTSGRLAGSLHALNSPLVNPYHLESFSPVATTNLTSVKAAIDRAKAEKQWYILSYHEIDAPGREYATTAADLAATIDYIQSTGVRMVTIKEGVAELR